MFTICRSLSWEKTVVSFFTWRFPKSQEKPSNHPVVMDDMLGNWHICWLGNPPLGWKATHGWTDNAYYVTIWKSRFFMFISIVSHNSIGYIYKYIYIYTQYTCIYIYIHIWRFPEKRGTPKSSILKCYFPYKPSILGYPHCRKPPYTKIHIISHVGIPPGSQPQGSSTGTKRQEWILTSEPGSLWLDRIFGFGSHSFFWINAG